MGDGGPGPQGAASAALMARARRVTPGGVNSPVRAFRSVGGEPFFVARGEGAYVWDVDGRRYLDFIGSFGPLILGHAAPAVVEAVVAAARQGTSFGATTPREVLLAEMIGRAVPSVEKVRFTSSGTEATMSALRVARAFSGRDKVVKFGGCYHGHADAFLSEAGSGVATLGIPGSAGVPTATAADTLTVPYNDLEAVRQVLAGPHGASVGAIIVEPIACNMGLVPPQPGYLAGLRALCDAHRLVLIFDEVITGFRVAAGGAQGLWGVRPDLTTFGKIVGGGLPVGAYGGRADIMDMVAPLGPVYQAGTLSGNPLAMAAGLATLEAVLAPGFHDALAARAAALGDGIAERLARHGAPAHLTRVGSIFHLWFVAGADHAPADYAAICRADTGRYATFFHRLLARGVSLAPSAFEVGFVGAAHGPDQIAQALAAMDEALADLPG